jgi:hypothetical protein
MAGKRGGKLVQEKVDQRKLISGRRRAVESFPLDRNGGLCQEVLGGSQENINAGKTKIHSQWS